MSLTSLAEAADRLIEVTSMSHWRGIASPVDIAELCESIACDEDALRRQIIAHNQSQIAVENAVSDSGVKVGLVLEEIRYPDDGAIDAAMKETGSSVNLGRCVMRDDVPEEVAYAHLRAQLVRREIRILLGGTAQHDPHSVLG